MRRIGGSSPADVHKIGREIALVNILRARQAASDRLYQLYDDNADFEVICRDYSWKFHKELLEGKSEYFKGLVRSACEPQEANESDVDLSKQEPQLLARLFQYVYNGKYALLNDDEIVPNFSVNAVCRRGWLHELEKFKELTWDETFCTLHLKMFLMGDYFMMPELQAYALRELRLAVQLVCSLEPVVETIEAFEELESMPQAQVDRIVTSLKKGLSKREPPGWDASQSAKLRELAEKVPGLRELI